MLNRTATFAPTSPWSTVETQSDMLQKHTIQDRIAISSGSYASTGTGFPANDTVSVMVTFRAAQP